MPDNKLGIGRISFPQDIDVSLLIALEEFVRRSDDNVGYLLKPQIVTVTSDYTADDLDHTVIADTTSGNITVTLPEASTVNGKILTIKNIAGNTATADGFNSETIDGSATYSLASQYKYVTIHSDGTEWHVISNN